jgi:hypothetical protein
MAAKFQKGDVVKVAAVVPQGPVQSFRMDDDGIVYCLIEWTDADGASHQRWFAQDDLVSA